jgi:hypothetical protein
MMKTIIEYGDSEGDKMELKRVMKATDMASLLFDIQVNMKRRIIHTLDADDATEAEYDLLEKVWGCINEEFESHEIYIDNLIN